MSEKDNMNHNELENEVEKVDDKDVVVEDQKKDDDEYEKVCFICHRPESQTGKMMDLPNHISVCPDCMQKSFDMMTDGLQPASEYAGSADVQCG